jgi:DNA topoisomerase-2
MVSDFGNNWECTDMFIKKIIELEAIQNILDWVKAKEQAALNAELRKLNKNLDKFDPKDVVKFHDATSKNRAETSLLIVEGLSALSGVLSGRDTKLHGIFPMKGVPLNVYDIDVKKLLESEEFVNLKAVLGLQLGKKVESVNDIRFGKIIFTTDSDKDGWHIRGLLANIFFKFWRELFDMGLIYMLNTPIVKVFWKKQTICFYTLEEFDDWRSTHLNDKFTFKYYKGLGTSGPDEWKEYFSETMWNDNLIQLKIENEEDERMFKLLFSQEKGMTDKRKEWLQLEESNGS